MARSNLKLEKRSVQLLQPTDTKTKSTLSNVAVCSGCHGCTNGGKLSPQTITYSYTDAIKLTL